jgi:hypothetical protein
VTTLSAPVIVHGGFIQLSARLAPEDGDEGRLEEQQPHRRRSRALSRPWYSTEQR